MASDGLNVLSVQPVPPEPSDSDSRRWEVEVAQGNTAAAVDVWVTGTDAIRVPSNVDGWIQDQVQREWDSIAAEHRRLENLITRSPIQLHPDPV